MSFNFKSIKKVLSFPFKVVSIIIATGLLLSYFSIFISPAKFWPIAYFGLFFQLFFILNLILLIIWGFIKNRMSLVHLFILLPSLFVLSSFIQLFNGERAQTDKDIKVVSYNTQMFQLRYKKADSTYFKVAAFLNSERADIICLQEFYTAPNKLDAADFGLNLHDINHSYIHFSINTSNYKYGIAIYSRYPIVDKGEIFTSSSGNTAIFTDLDIDGTIIRVYNNHLQSIRLNLPKSVRKIIYNNQERMGEIADLSIRLKTAFIRRAEQVDKVAEHIRQSPYPVIVCGDFNDTPMSYTYHTMMKGLKDAFREAGQGMPSTHEGFFPSFRIDYILHDERITTVDYNVSDVHYSDHFPIIARLNLYDIDNNK